MKHDDDEPDDEPDDETPEISDEHHRRIQERGPVTLELHRTRRHPEPVLVLGERRDSAVIAAAIARGRERPHLLLLDRPQARAPETDLGEVFEMGPLMPVQPYRRVDVDVPARAEPFVCAPLRLSDCPRCKAQPGDRCIGIDRDDEVHVERLWQCLGRWNGAS